MSLIPEITRAEALAYAITKSPPSSSARTQNVMVRTPINLMSLIDVLRAPAGKSRSAMCVHLIEVGLTEVQKHIPEEEMAEFLEASFELGQRWLLEIAEQEQEQHQEG